MSKPWIEAPEAVCRLLLKPGEAGALQRGHLCEHTRLCMRQALQQGQDCTATPGQPETAASHLGENGSGQLPPLPALHLQTVTLCW
jgi:hypothetical protein